eukprot:1160076-Pelagomonas_calceolata.AAC.8
MVCAVTAAGDKCGRPEPAAVLPTWLLSSCQHLNWECRYVPASELPAPQALKHACQSALLGHQQKLDELNQELKSAQFSSGCIAFSFCPTLWAGPQQLLLFVSQIEPGQGLEDECFHGAHARGDDHSGAST